MTVTAYLYDAEGRDRQVELSPESLGALGERNLLWIHVDGRDSTELRPIAETLGLEHASVRTLLRPGRASHLENFGGYSQFAIMPAPVSGVGGVGAAGTNGAGRRHSQARLDFVVSKDWILTVHEGPLEFIEEFRAKGRTETAIGNLTTHDFAASMLDAHLEIFFEEIARIEAMIDRLDEQALIRPSSRTLLGRMVSLRRRVSRLRTSLSSQRAVFYGLARPDVQLVSESGASPHFQVLVARFERAIDEVEHSRDLIVGSFELFATRTAQQTNDLVKVLTFLTAVVGICAAVAGVFGMNFTTGLFQSGDAGFYVTVGTLLFVILVATVVARVRGWL